MDPLRLGQALAAAAYTWVAVGFWQPAVADEPEQQNMDVAQSASVPTASMPDLEAFVDGVVSGYMAQLKIAGAQVAVVKDGRTLLAKGYGIDSIAPQRRVDPERSLFRIGSISKTFIWLSLMQLAEQGKLELTHPINDYLPDELDVSDEGFEQPIRIVDLMNHTAGFEDALQRLFVAEEAALLPINEQLRKYRPHRVREPGRLMAYSNYGSALAGFIVAQVSGMPFESYVEQNILGPLGMTNTTFREQYAPVTGLPEPMPQEMAQRKAQNLEWEAGAWKVYAHEHIVSMAPAGAAVSTATDMARYMTALLDPDVLERAGVLRRRSLEQLREPTFQSAPGMPAMHHGFFNTPLGATTPLQLDNLSHAGATLHFFSFMTLIPDLSPRPRMNETSDAAATTRGQGSLGIFITTNSIPGARLTQALPERILTRYFSTSITEEPAASIPSTAQLAQYAGQYRSLRRSYTKFDKLLSLPAASPVAVTDDGRLLVTSGAETARYEQIGTDLFRRERADTTVAFLRDDAGKVTHMVTGGGARERIGYFQSMPWMILIVHAGLLVSIGIVVVAVLRWRRPTFATAAMESVAERRSAQIMLGAAIAWLVFAAAAMAWVTSLSGPGMESRFVFGYPQTSLKVALAVLLVAAGLTLLATASLVAVWREGNWSTGRRMRHTLAAVVLLALVITLLQWNVVGFKYF
jgi:CubicO group peptidase (beta-lactamase class C family)